MSFGPSKQNPARGQAPKDDDAHPQNRHVRRRPIQSARVAKQPIASPRTGGRLGDESVNAERRTHNCNLGGDHHEPHTEHVPASCNTSPADRADPLGVDGESRHLPPIASAWVTPRASHSSPPRPGPSPSPEEAAPEDEEGSHHRRHDGTVVQCTSKSSGGNSSNSQQHFTVLGGTGCGQIFDLIKEFLVMHRAPHWVDGGDALLSIVMHGVLPPLIPLEQRQQQPSRPSALNRRGSAAAGRASASAAPCCDRLASVSLYLGDKASAERFLEESRIVAMRLRRRSSAVRRSNIGGGALSSGLLACPHQRALEEALERHQVPAPPVGSNATLVNYIEGFRCITLKSRLVRTMRAHYHGKWEELGAFLPLTFQLSPDNNASTGGGAPRDERNELVQAMCQCNAEEFEASGEIATYWIAKTSHGAHGSNIRIFFADQIGLDKLIRFIDSQKDPYAWVVSRYVDRPLLYQRRKFDLRHWVLVTPSFDIYLHRQLVMRTSSEIYDRNNLSTDNAKGRLANITNHCVQAEGNRFEQFETGNELWRSHLDHLIREHYAAMSRRARRSSRACTKYVLLGKTKDGGGGGDGGGGAAATAGATLDNCIMPQIRHIIVETIRAARSHVPQQPLKSSSSVVEAAGPSCEQQQQQQQRLVQSFQLMGYDFIVDDQLNVWLLEVNGSPGVAQKLVHTIVEDTVELVVDPLFPSDSPSQHRRVSREKNEFDCIMRGSLL